MKQTHRGETTFLLVKRTILLLKGWAGMEQTCRTKLASKRSMSTMHHCVRRHGVSLMQLLQEEKVGDFQEVMGM